MATDTKSVTNGPSDVRTMVAFSTEYRHFLLMSTNDIVETIYILIA